MKKETEEITFPSGLPLLIRKNDVTGREVTAYPNAIHEAIEIKLFYDGESLLLVGDETIRAKSGDIVIINPYELHATLDSDVTNRGKYYLFMIGLDFFDGVPQVNFNLRRLMFNMGMTFKHSVRDEKIAEVLMHVVDEYDKKGEGHELSIFGAMCDLFALLLHHKTTGSGEIPKETVRNHATIEPAVRMIRDGYYESFTLNDLATACNMSKYYFTRIFKATNGVSPMQYLTEYRLKVADAYIKSSDMSISEIAAIVGFSDAGYFAKLYKRIYGNPPSKSGKIDN